MISNPIFFSSTKLKRLDEILIPILKIMNNSSKNNDKRHFVDEQSRKF